MTVVPLTATAKWSWSFVGGESARGRHHAGDVGAGDEPCRLPERGFAGGRDQSGIAVQRARDVPTRVVELQRLALRAHELGVDAAVAWAGGDQLGRDDVFDLTPGAHDHGQRVGSGPGPQHLVGGLDAGPVQRRADAVAGGLDVGPAVEQGRKLLAADPVRERLRVGADDRRNRVGRGPIVQVPPDVVTRVDVGGGRSLGRLDPVDVVEPVEVARAAAVAVDRLGKAAAVAGRDLEVALQQRHHGLRAGHVSLDGASDQMAAEAARHLDARVLGARSCAEAAPGDRRRRRDRGQRGEAAAGTASGHPQDFVTLNSSFSPLFSLIRQAPLEASLPLTYRPQ